MSDNYQSQIRRGIRHRAEVALASCKRARDALRASSRRGTVLDPDTYEAVSAALYEAERLAGEVIGR